MDNEKRTERDDLIIGRNAVSEALKSGRAIDTLLVAKGERNGSIGQILAKCRDLGVVIKEVDRKKLDMMCNSSTHQGVAAYAASHEYASNENLLIFTFLFSKSSFSASLSSIRFGASSSVSIPLKTICPPSSASRILF